MINLPLLTCVSGLVHLQRPIYNVYRYYESAADAKNKESGKMSALLNNAPASFEGVLLRFRKPASYVYMCSRNNNFSNRSQKGKITVA